MIASIGAARLERLFAATFRATHATELRGGAPEPLYVPADKPGACAVIHYRHDFVASALHEVAHWCIAGAHRRTLPDYGYWYAEAGRDRIAQIRFEQVEVRPQAIESIFAASLGLAFQVSLDNPGADEFDPAPFAAAVAAERARLQRQGLPARAVSFLRGLRALRTAPAVAA